MTTTSLDRLADRLENYYDFSCEGGPLKNCVEWQELRARAEQAEAKLSDLTELYKVGCEDREQMAAKVAAHEAALRRLANEASAFLSMADTDAHGVTNCRVLQLRIDEARALAASPTPPAKEK